MASIKVKFRPSTQVGKKGTIYYQIIKNRTVRQINTNYRISPERWNRKATTENQLTTNHAINACIQLDIERLKLICSHKELSAEDIVHNFSVQKKEQSFFEFMRQEIALKKQLNKTRTSQTYAATLRSLQHFRNNMDIAFADFDSDLMVLYEARLKKDEVCMNTISFYMRILRAVYNRAVEKELIIQNNPFKKVYTGIDKTEKRAISFRNIKKIQDLKLPEGSTIAFARDLFLFSFCTCGMSFIDMAFLKKSNLKKDLLTYQRQKTGKQIKIGWNNKAQEILDRNPVKKKSPFLLPIIDSEDLDARQQCQNKLSTINRQLKKIAKRIGLTTPLTTYVARHTWASVAHSKEVSISIISDALGHHSETTTQIYLASLDISAINRANNRILKDL